MSPLRTVFLCFVRSGIVRLSNSALRNVGLEGVYWSRTVDHYDSLGSAMAYGLYFYLSVNSENGTHGRQYGFPVRCLVILIMKHKNKQACACKNLMIFATLESGQF